MSEGRRLKVRSSLLKAVGPPVPPPRQRSQKKSKKNAYILFAGQAEGGKSTTLNTLFGGRKITPVERETGTQEVLEFCASLTSGSIHLIDTPGIGDMNGLEWDAQVISTIETFRMQHKELQTCIPNIVLIVARFDDNRIAGDMSTFVKMLKSINYQRSKFLDSNHNNLIILLTHFMNGNKTLRANPETRIELVKNLVKTYTNFVHEPIVLLGENEGEDWELELAVKKSETETDSVDQETQLSSHLLPNGDSYPQNIIDSIFLICKESNNVLGEKIFKEAFTKPKVLQFEQIQSLNILDTANEITQRTMVKLTNIYFTTRSSEMFSKLNDTWTAMGRSSTEACYEALLMNLEKCRYRDFEQLPKTQDLINEFLIKLKPTFDEGLFVLIQKTFNWEPSRLITIIKRNVGYGFNIGYDDITAMSPFDFQLNPYRPTPIIYRLTNEIKYHPINNNEEEKLIFHVFTAREEYWNARMKDFHLKPGQKIVTEGKLKSGYNIFPRETLPKAQAPKPPSSSMRRSFSFGLNKSASATQRKSIVFPETFLNQPESITPTEPKPPSTPTSTKQKIETITIAKEYRIGKLVLQDDVLTHLAGLFDTNFYSKVTKLTTFNPKIRASMNEWRGFLHTFGTHVVKSAYIGGVIEVTIDKNKLIEKIRNNENGKELNTSNMATCENDLKKELMALFDFETDMKKFDEGGLILKLETKGGNKLLTQVENFFKLGASEKLKYFNSWKESIHELPTILDRNVQLIEMKKFVEIIFGKSNETKPLLDSFDIALETLYYTIPKRDRNWKICTFL